MRIACIGYRDWSINIYKRLQSETENHFLMQLSKNDFSEEKIEEFNPDFILFYGWSDIISARLIDQYKCLMLHPSPLPKYRGGSPIQNQIIRGEIHSAVSIFLMNAGVDSGPIAKQAYLSLEGSIEEVFQSIEDVGYRLTLEILSDGIEFLEQDHEQATSFPRRAPRDSEITLEELQKMPAVYLKNKVRMLQGPYPKPYIVTADKKKLYIHEVSLDEEV